MIYGEDPFRRRPGKSTAGRKRREKCDRMAKNRAKCASGYSQITKNRPPDGCGGGAVPLAVERWYDFHEFVGYLGNVGLEY